MRFLHITVHWLDDRYHGLLGRDGPPEWPPSPYRLFQALVAGAARAGKLDKLTQPLHWLELQAPPMIITPPSAPGQIITRFVPNNDGNKRPDRQDRLTGKTFRPTIMLADPAVHYLWRYDATAREIDGIIDAARSLICLGLGIDMAFADARTITEEQVGAINGTRWLPKAGTFRDEGMLRVPQDQSLDDLLRAHQSALERIVHDNILRSVQKPRAFNTVLYTSSERPLGRPYKLFTLRDAEGDFSPEPQAKLIHVAGMVRHAAIKAMTAYPPPGIPDPAKWIETFVAGHRNGSNDHKQFSYIPLPSIGNEHADCNIRRVVIVAPFGEDANLAHLAEQLDGRPLEPEGGGIAPILRHLRGDGVTSQYTRRSIVWATITPIILPGHDDHKPAKTKKLLETALRQSGIELSCEFTWGAVPNFKNCLSAYTHDRHGRPIGYFRPGHLAGLTTVHARLTFAQPIAGPLIIGAGRHCGLGLLAAAEG
jgi:CRISPR-associated protein Csb2